MAPDTGNGASILPGESRFTDPVEELVVCSGVDEWMVDGCDDDGLLALATNVDSAWPRGASAIGLRGVELSSQGGSRPGNQSPMVPARMDLCRATGSP